MPKILLTFGQSHRHEINGLVLDKDCVAIIEGDTYEEADELAFLLFNGKFHQHVPEHAWDDADMKYFPRGYIEVE